MSKLEKQSAQKQDSSVISEWNIVPKGLFFTLNLMIYAIHALETTYYVKELKLREYEVGFIYAFQLIPFLVSIWLGNLADAHAAHRDMAIYLTAIYCLANAVTSVKGVVEGNPPMIIGLKIVASCCSGAVFPFVDAMVVSMLAQRGTFSKDSFGSQRMFGSLGHLFATALCHRFNYYLVSHDGMFCFLNLSGLFFILVILLGIPPDMKIEKGSGHHHHAPPQANKISQPLPFGVPSTSPVPTHTPSPSPLTHEQDTDKCLKVAEQVQMQISATPAPPPVHLEAVSPVIRLLTSLEFLAFLAFILCAGYSRSVMTIYQKHYVVGVLEKSDSNLDFMEFFRTGSEMAIYYTSKYIIAWLGPHWVLLISQTSGLLRMLIYAFYSTIFTDETSENLKIGVICFGELMKGLNTGMMMSCAIRVANEMAPSGCEGSAQSLLSGSYNALGLTVAGVLSGLVLYVFKDLKNVAYMSYMFIFSSALSAIFIVLFFIKFAFYDKVLFNKAQQ